MKKLISTKGLSEREWRLWRRNGIGGSDASVIMGVNPYRSILDLWDDKCGNTELAEEENRFTYFGHLMEPVIRKEFRKRTGLQVRQKHAILQSEEYPWMIADLDGIVKDTDGSYAVFEAKTASEYRRDVWEKNVPEEYYAQVQHYLVVTGYERAYVAAIVGGNSYYCHMIERDSEYMKMLIEKERVFWNHVESRTRQEIDSSEATTEYLNKKYDRSENDAIVLPDSAVDIIREYQSVDSDIKKLADKKNYYSNQLKELLQEHEVGHAGDYKVSWVPVVRKTLDSELVKTALKEEYSNYLKEVRYRKLQIA